MPAGTWILASSLILENTLLWSAGGVVASTLISAKKMHPRNASPSIADTLAGMVIDVRAPHAVKAKIIQFITNTKEKDYFLHPRPMFGAGLQPVFLTAQ